MHWISEMSTAQPVAWAVLVLMTVAVVGLAISSLKIRGVGIGITGILFAGILAGHLGLRIEKEILEFVREFGLILFVFTIGLQLGPGFFASLRASGLKLNLLAASVILLGAVFAIGVAYLAGVDIVAALGLFSGATTNTPSLGAIQETLKGLGGDPALKATLPALAYAVAYPGGVVGIIIVLLLIRGVFRINAEQEAEQFRAEQKRGVDPLERMNLLVENPNVENLPLADVPGREAGVVVSRIKRAGGSEVETATEQTVLHRGDVILAVGTRKALDKFRVVIGRVSDVNLVKAPGRVTSRKIVVTRKDVLGKTIEEIDLDDLYGVTVTRVTRADIEMTAVPELKLQFGDTLQVVGDEQAIGKAAHALGNRLHALTETNFIPIFVGIALGVLVGTLPISVPNMPVPVRLGIAGGPLVLAILLSRIGRMGPLVWHAGKRKSGFPRTRHCAVSGVRRPQSREKFLPLSSRPRDPLGTKRLGYHDTADSDHWAHRSNCDEAEFYRNQRPPGREHDRSPALAFANAISGSDAPSVSYATVYPLTILLRIVTVQVLVLVFCR
jgi:putative transport protein